MEKFVDWLKKCFEENKYETTGDKMAATLGALRVGIEYYNLKNTDVLKIVEMVFFGKI